ncbi:hypothetical protein HK102_005404 [Quaeritorhiza haematococci]|nr:hypothetical protein HK102_005404 [Quaeritorhiza haematococci]
MVLPAEILRAIGVWLEDSQDFVNLGVALHHVWEPSVQGQRLLLKHGIDEIHYHLPVEAKKCKDIVRYLSREDPDYSRRIFDEAFWTIACSRTDKHREPGSKFREACLEYIAFNHGRVFRLLIDTGQIDWTESPRALEAAFGDVRWLIRCGWRVNLECMAFESASDGTSCSLLHSNLKGQFSVK